MVLVNVFEVLPLVCSQDCSTVGGDPSHARELTGVGAAVGTSGGGKKYSYAVVGRTVGGVASEGVPEIVSLPDATVSLPDDVSFPPTLSSSLSPTLPLSSLTSVVGIDPSTAKPDNDPTAVPLIMDAPLAPDIESACSIVACLFLLFLNSEKSGSSSNEELTHL